VKSVDQQQQGELRLFLEEICCELCRYRHVAANGIAPERVSTIREVGVRTPGNFADIKVIPGNGTPYFVEIKWGYAKNEFLDRITRKYAVNPDDSCGKLIVVTDVVGDDNRSQINDLLRQRICPSLEIELWGEREIIDNIKVHFGLEIAKFSAGNYRAIRDTLTRAEWEHAFDETYNDQLASTLLWHFSSWKLRQLREEYGMLPDAILRPNIYKDLVIIMADLCSFSRYVQDTRNNTLVRQMLTVFYSQARQAIIETGGMLENFIGDEAVGIFGFPEPVAGYHDDAIRCAYRLLDIGNSISEHWRRNLDKPQKSGGVHIGIAMGDLNFMPLRAFSSSHFGFVGDAMNMTARLVAAARPREVVISNSLYQTLQTQSQVGFEEESKPIKGKNIGLINCWRRRSSAYADYVEC
jgi:adenylate cyclase